MGRVSEPEVEKIIEVDSSLDVAPFINSANLVVTDKLGGEGLSAAILKDVELWLSAHFVAVFDPRAKSEKIGDAQATYYGDATGKGLNSTPYGQQAIAIDPTGKLATAGKRRSKVETIDIEIE